eukprot:TRINITY_DN5539_c0_g4_i3.p1 TRINITY_DN5539_c0_g4~~TRINITY_DN5539_c0_g4_i3.p1  ORF type:complete len:121 (-),score=18.19 TRINITY_DN5539_c0_g4_i3:196-558(-)
MPPKSKELFFPVKDEIHWNEITSPENEKVTFIDLYTPYFGRCEVLDEGLRTLFLMIDDADTKVQFFHADITKIPCLQNKFSKLSAKPHFQIYLVNLQLNSRKESCSCTWKDSITCRSRTR